MPRRSVALALAGGAVLVVATLGRRRRSAPREQVTLYYEDGSSVSLEPASPDAERVLALARRALAVARAA